MWTPDTFFSNANSVATISMPTPTLFASVSTNGTVLMSHKLQITTRCLLKERYLECPLEIESYGYSIKDIEYHWPRGNGSVSIGSQLPGSAGYKFVEKIATKKSIKLSSGTFTLLEFIMRFDRDNLF
ncbi:gamma-aminobutyric acid receptor subunit alpha-6-like [Oppia nitens]|uniref:gamma-aminobutyric acid receptor subunit alpha-6-like n=1 Tax=Oppia nitens TaxID=1686743 RepID=UPI0023DA5A33|nr:gamma-aminobutyric acid receptor subunit alpha-6-like [Oppia nitens]